MISSCLASPLSSLRCGCPVKTWHETEVSRQQAATRFRFLKARHHYALSRGGTEAAARLRDAPDVQEIAAPPGVSDAQLMALGSLPPGIATAAVANGASMGLGGFARGLPGVPRDIQPSSEEARRILQGRGAVTAGLQRHAEATANAGVTSAGATAGATTGATATATAAGGTAATAATAATPHLARAPFARPQRFVAPPRGNTTDHSRTAPSMHAINKGKILASRANDPMTLQSEGARAAAAAAAAAADGRLARPLAGGNKTRLANGQPVVQSAGASGSGRGTRGQTRAHDNAVPSTTLDDRILAHLYQQHPGIPPETVRAKECAFFPPFFSFFSTFQESCCHVLVSMRLFIISVTLPSLSYRLLSFTNSSVPTST